MVLFLCWPETSSDQRGSSPRAEVGFSRIVRWENLNFDCLFMKSGAASTCNHWTTFMPWHLI